MRSRRDHHSSPPWWVWATCLALPLAALVVRRETPQWTPNEFDNWNATHAADAWDAPTAGPRSAAARPALPVTPAGTISLAAPPATPAYQFAPGTSAAPAPLAPRETSSATDSATSPRMASALAPNDQPGLPASSVISLPAAEESPVATTGSLAEQFAVSTTQTDIAATVTTAAPVSRPTLLPPMSAPVATAPVAATMAAEPQLPTPAEHSIVVDLPELAAPTPDQIAAATPATDEVAAEVQDELATTETTPSERAPRDTARTARRDAPTSAISFETADSRQVAAMGSLTIEKIEQRARQQIAAGFDLARRGAYYAARLKFVGVLRMIADAGDAVAGSVDRAAALAAGLRALDEAEDFLRLPADVDLRQETSVLLRSHKTPLGQIEVSAGMAPADLAKRYYDYAQQQLAAAVGAEPAGSMALHALGKLASEQYQAAAVDYPLGLRRAVALQHAALLARGDNYLAAHELGVLLAETGHYGDSVDLLRQVASEQPHPTVLRNLAQVERSLGRGQAAQLADQEAARLAATTPDARVAWVPPQQFAGPQQQGPAAMPPAQTPYGGLGMPRHALRPPMPSSGANQYMR